MSVKAVIFDLDDTLFPELDYVRSGFKAAAAVAKNDYGVIDAENEFNELFAVSRERVFDRFAEKHGLGETAAKALTDAYREHEPDISLTEETRKTLVALREKGYKLGVITDGRPSGQRKKIDALGLNGLVDEIIITDELGGKDYRKPDPRAFTTMAERLGVALNEMVYVGDNPQKDFAVKKYLPVKTARLFGGGIYAYADYCGDIKEDIVLGKISELCESDLNAEAYDGQKAVRELLLEIMDRIHEVCEKENITYSLSGGTLIGAVRHKGFVPWDDDIDVVMKREEYNKFVSAVKAYGGDIEIDGQSSRVPQVRYSSDPVYDGKRYHGVKIDIFILDNFPDGEKARNKLVLKLKTLQGMMRKDKVTWSNYSVKGKILLLGTKFLGMFRSLKSLIASYNKTSEKYNGQATENKFISNDLFAVMGITYKNEWFDSTSDARFEDRTYRIFKAYDDILKLRYGDYMKLPSKNKREPWHEITVTELD